MFDIFNFMKKYIYFLLIMFSCIKSQSQSTLINPSGSTISTRFLTPKGFVRLNTIENSFGSYLQNLELQKHGSLVHLYDGTIKTNQKILILFQNCRLFFN